jgi:glycosyltransferase involved in cell wall biosynthesis
MRSRLSVIHDGIDCDRIKPDPEATLHIKRAGLTLRPGDEVVTFINRNLEPYRGFHSFMRMLPDLQRLRPNAQVVIIGGNQISYGQPAPKQFQTWKRYLLHEMGALLDPSRLHFIGHVPHQTLHDVLSISACHVYLTVPFVLSWSLLEAMACGALVVASATPPVQEVIRDGFNGRLVPFADPFALARTIAEVLTDPERHAPLRQAARRTVLERYDLHSVCLPQQLALVDRLLERRRPSPPKPPEAVKPLLFRPPAPRLR